MRVLDLYSSDAVIEAISNVFVWGPVAGCLIALLIFLISLFIMGIVKFFRG